MDPDYKNDAEPDPDADLDPQHCQKLSNFPPANGDYLYLSNFLHLRLLCNFEVHVMLAGGGPAVRACGGPGLLHLGEAVRTDRVLLHLRVSQRP